MDAYTAPMPPTVAYLALGKVRIKEPGKPSRLLDSPYATTIHERAVRSQQRHSWKSGDGGGFLSGPMLWGGAGANPGPPPVLITSICRGTGQRQLTYSLESGTLCALLKAENLGEEEARLWNDNQTSIIHVDTCPRTGDHCMSVQHENGTANIGVMIQDETGVMEGTEGDSVDTAPRWVPGDERRLVYQSAGVGRDREGNFGGFGPFSIELLNIDTADLETLAQDRRFDHVAPRMTADGDLFFIRRPWNEHARIRPVPFLKDFFMLPLRVLYAFFQWLNFFSMSYTGKKLTTSGGPGQPGPDLKQMRIWGNVVAAQNDSDSPDQQELIPKSWQLIRRDRSGKETILAKAVLAYDLLPDGGIVYSTGAAVHHLSPAGKSEKLFTDEMIEQVVAIPET